MDINCKIINRNDLRKIEWNWNGNSMENFEQKYSMRYGMEKAQKWNGYGMEKKRQNTMEWKWKGNGMGKKNQQSY